MWYYEQHRTLRKKSDTLKSHYQTIQHLATLRDEYIGSVTVLVRNLKKYYFTCQSTVPLTIQTKT